MANAEMQEEYHARYHLTQGKDAPCNTCDGKQPQSPAPADEDAAFGEWWLRDFGYPGIDRYDGPPARDVARAAWDAATAQAEAREAALREGLDAVIETVNEAQPFAKPPAISGHYFGESSWVKIEDVTRLLNEALARTESQG